MGDRNKLFFVLFILGFGHVASQDYYELRHAQHLKTQNMGHLKEIPKRFEIQGDNARQEFTKYINDIYDLAKDDNVTVLYKVKVETLKPFKPFIISKKLMKIKPKKYNIPLKRKSMKLSNFEIIMRKLADTSGSQAYPVMTTEDPQKPKHIVTTKVPVWKYKPIVGKVHLNNYAKRIKPVRNPVITLTSH